MSQLLSTQDKQDVLVRDYHRESKEMAANVADHPKMSNHNTAKWFSTVEALAKNYATIALRLDEWDRWCATLNGARCGCSASAIGGHARSCI